MASGTFSISDPLLGERRVFCFCQVSIILCKRRMVGLRKLETLLSLGGGGEGVVSNGNDGDEER